MNMTSDYDKVIAGLLYIIIMLVNNCDHCYDEHWLVEIVIFFC